MNSFSDEIRIIPRTAWVIALVAYGCLSSVLMFVAMPQDPKLSHWPLVGQITFSFGIPLTLLVSILLIGYVNADARRRGMRYVMWTLLAIFLPNMLGIILYFVLRDPMPVRCAECGRLAGPGFAFCPQCGAQLSQACPSCKRPVDPTWQRCAYCGVALKPVSPASQMERPNR
jgi:RNA polymerase subunit RPABC4/transcription elongation factor Spt4